MSAAEERRRLEQYRELGRQAARAGRKQDSCPYKLGTSTEQRDAWLTGWDEAATENRARSRR